jgi:hypothetical protein
MQPGDDNWLRPTENVGLSSLNKNVETTEEDQWYFHSNLLKSIKTGHSTTAVNNSRNEANFKGKSGSISSVSKIMTRG